MRPALNLICAFALSLSVAGLARAQAQPTGTHPSADDPGLRPHRLTIEFTTLRIMRDKGLITEDEY